MDSGLTLNQIIQGMPRANKSAYEFKPLAKKLTPKLQEKLIKGEK